MIEQGLPPRRPGEPDCSMMATRDKAVPRKWMKPLNAFWNSLLPLMRSQWSGMSG
jgi:hypothetical protein